LFTLVNSKDNSLKDIIWNFRILINLSILFFIYKSTILFLNLTNYFNII
jgi:hypothetical protein